MSRLVSPHPLRQAAKRTRYRRQTLNRTRSTTRLRKRRNRRLPKRKRRPTSKGLRRTRKTKRTIDLRDQKKAEPQNIRKYPLCPMKVRTYLHLMGAAGADSLQSELK